MEEESPPSIQTERPRLATRTNLRPIRPKATQTDGSSPQKTRPRCSRTYRDAPATSSAGACPFLTRAFRGFEVEAT